MGGLCGDGNGLQLEWKQGADLASTQGVESWFGGWVHEGLADLDEAVLAPIGAGEGWIDGMGCSSVYCWIEVAIQGASGLATSICVWGRSKILYSNSTTVQSAATEENRAPELPPVLLQKQQQQQQQQQQTTPTTPRFESAAAPLGSSVASSSSSQSWDSLSHISSLSCSSCLVLSHPRRRRLRLLTNSDHQPSIPNTAHHHLPTRSTPVLESPSPDLDPSDPVPNSDPTSSTHPRSHKPSSTSFEYWDEDAIFCWFESGSEAI
ncbi:hypothetical protein M0R45_037326 [Rubus argutus]|uniref:Uncharacterized protein n=1 Tax=Rubus argutus TaxID=59490 RepID=A0AAW1VYT8_RUBAR